MPSDAFSEISTYQRGDKRSEVDAHVKKSEASITTRIALFVELANHRRNIRLEEAGADDDERQAKVKRRHSLHCETEVAERDQDSAHYETSARSKKSIGEITPEERSEIRQRRVCPIEIGRARSVPFESIHQVEN